tara:strand:- start:134452 stop:134928 length:477 start_codon:yes stop_codon:yes gene_type:complete
MKSVSFTLMFLFCFCGYSQDNKIRSIYLELGGSGGLGSINYEASIFPSLKSDLHRNTWRAGFSVAPIDKNNGTGLVFPIMINSLIGRKNHLLELGVGQGVTITTRGSFFTLTTAAVGYRFESSAKPWFFRATYTPLISYLVDFQVQQWGGISLGYRFK